ncbi:MAG: protein-methionine-sulfoxide reductase catalytic subunit MsrP [Hyphomicrobiaceae bacterium]
MLIRRPPDIPSCEITPEPVYLRRRAFLAGSLAAATTLATPPLLAPSARAGARPRRLTFTKSPYSTDEPLSRFRDVTHYNNFIEFGTRKTDPAYFANAMTIDPWSVEIDGLVAKPQRLALDDIVKPVALEERIYRLRCVEAWSMVIPWIGFPLSALLKRVEPLGTARYVAFETLHRPAQMRGQRKPRPVVAWPYREGLRLDEAMHPLTILAVGLYGRTLPHQNGAPLRLVVPWKYGFKSIKSIVRISLVAEQPATSWQTQWAAAYGFFANVNPDVPHPDWSQASERRVGYGSSLFSARRPTESFNGYGADVAGLYKGMDLARHY